MYIHTHTHTHTHTRDIIYVYMLALIHHVHTLRTYTISHTHINVCENILSYAMIRIHHLCVCLCPCLCVCCVCMYSVEQRRQRQGERQCKRGANKACQAAPPSNGWLLTTGLLLSQSSLNIPESQNSRAQHILSLSLSLSLSLTHTAPSPPLRRHLQPRRREASKPLPLLPPRRSPPTHTDNPPPHTQLPRGGWRLSYPPTHPPILAQAHRHSHTESTQRGGIRRTQHPTTQLLNYRTNFTQLPY